jgi:L-2-hydroxyglutarate oxidase LhgO
LIVAVHEEELPRLKQLYERGVGNGVEGLELIDGDKIVHYEPHLKGLGAIWSPNTGITDYRQVALCMAKEVHKVVAV